MSDFYYYINEPFVNMRELPSVDSAVVSQAYFSERIFIRDEKNGWSYIISSDGYGGWIHSQTVVKLPMPYENSLKISRNAAHIYAAKDTAYGSIAIVPYGSQLKVLDTSDRRWLKIAFPIGKEAYIQRGDVASEPMLVHKQELDIFSRKFLGLPYVWGGRTSFGYDCSGFVQMLYKQIGVNLERDSKLQVKQNCLREVAVEGMGSGDLVFFGKSEQKIQHVGMYIGHGQFIHATVRENQPWIRISNLSDPEWSGGNEVYYPYRTFRQLII